MTSLASSRNYLPNVAFELIGKIISFQILHIGKYNLRLVNYRLKLGGLNEKTIVRPNSM